MSNLDDGKVYLCGGISGLSDEDCRDWREVAKQTLCVETIDPMRRDYRGKEDESVAEIVNGDLSDIRASRIVLINATRPSWGTAMEVVYAQQWNKKTVAFTGDSKVSPWLRHHVGTIVPTLDAAVSAINAEVVERRRVMRRR